MTRVARLSADLTANSTSFESSLQRANRAMNQSKRQWNSALGQANRQFSRFDGHVRKSVESIFDLRTQLGGLATVAASALTVQKVIQYSDTWKQLEGRLKIVSENMDEVNRSQEQLFDIAQRTRQPLEGIVSFYTRLKQFVPEAERAQYDFLGVTESVASALAITGETGASATAAMIQFTQAIGTNFEAAGQEIRSLQEQAPRLSQALANALGDGTKSLKQLQQEGALTRQSVLGALGALSDEAKVLAGELEQIPLTVGQALTRLDNAFLKFIGQTDAIRSGTGSLALAISVLAENFEILATAVTGLAVVFGVRLLQSLGAVIASMTVAAARTVAFNYTLGTLAFGSRAASVAMIGLAGATTALGTAIAFLGGPIGVAVLGTLALMTQYTNAAKDAQNSLNKAVAEHQKAASEYISASDERRRAIRENTKANIENYKKELVAIERIATALDNENALFRFSRKIGSKLGIDTTADEVRQVADQVRGVISELESDLESFGKLDKLPRPGTSAGGDLTDKQQKVVQNILDDLKSEAELLEESNRLYGEKETAIKKAQSALKIQQQLEAQGIKLSKEQANAIDEYLDKIEKQTELQEEQAKQQEELEERERDRQQALNQLGATFESAFEKAIEDGEKLSDVLQGLLDDIVKLLTRVTITEPLGNAITDIFGNIGSSVGSSAGGDGGGFLSGIGDFIGGLFGGGTGSFATGIDYVPYDMTARIHKGEAVVSAGELRGMRQGGDVNVIINNNADAQVTTQSRETSSGTELRVMIDQAVAENIGRRGSKTNSAIKALQDQTLIRR